MVASKYNNFLPVLVMVILLDVADLSTFPVINLTKSILLSPALRKAPSTTMTSTFTNVLTFYELRPSFWSFRSL